MLALSASTAGARKGWLRRYVKPYAWRFTGVYFWITALDAIFGFYDGVVNLERSLLDGLVALGSIGFEPVNANYLDGVIRVLWVLIITAARPRDLLGLSLYVLTFPVWVFGLYLLKLFLRFYSQYKTMESLTQPESYTVQDRPFRPLALCTALLGAWFILYGGAAEWQQIVPGIILSGIILLLLALRLTRTPYSRRRCGPSRVACEEFRAGDYSLYERIGDRGGTLSPRYRHWRTSGLALPSSFGFPCSHVTARPQGAREDHHASVRRVHYLSHHGCSVGGSLLGLGH